MRPLCIFLFITSVLAFDKVISQPQGSDRGSLYFSAGRSFTGTKDLKGLYIASGFTKDYKHINIAVEAVTTQYSGYDILFYSNPNNPAEQIDGSIRYNTYGIQLNMIVSYRLLKKLKHNLNIGIGPLFRYQSTSIPDQYTILFPTYTRLNVPVLYFINTEPQNTYAAGGIVKLIYRYQLSKKLNIAFPFSFQIDSNGDTIANGGLSVGYSIL